MRAYKTVSTRFYNGIIGSCSVKNEFHNNGNVKEESALVSMSGQWKYLVIRWDMAVKFYVLYGLV